MGAFVFLLCLAMLKSGWALILNPHAKGGRANELGQDLFKALDKQGIDYKLYLTKVAGGGELSARQCIDDGYRNILIAGGDGSVYDVINGLFLHPLYDAALYKLAIFPIGTGNDFARFTKLPESAEDFVAALKIAHTDFFDVGEIERENEPLRYFLNVAGFGFDAQVAARANLFKQRGYSGQITYLWALLTTLFKYRELDYTIETDDTSFRASVFTLLVGNGSHAGNGMRLIPDASPQDGFFHVTCVTKISRWKVVANVHRIFSGTFKHFKEVRTYKTKALRIIPHGKSLMQLDGEVLQGGALKIRIVPSAVKLLISSPA